MNVGDIMTTPAPTVTTDTRVAEIARLILDTDAEGLAVIDADGRLVGVVTENDLVAKHARVHAPRYLGFLGGILPLDSGRMGEELRHVLAVTAADLMNRDPVTVGPDTSVDDAATLMVDDGINPLLVTQDDRVLGLLSHSDVIRLLMIEEADDAPED